MARKIMKLGTYHTLVSQLDKLARHNRQGCFRTKDRYYQAMKRFCAYLADEFHLQKLANISGKHLVSYVLYLQENGLATSTIKTDLAAIRFFHDKMSDPKYELPTNDELGVELERRCFGGVDRTWSNVEFNKMLGRALGNDRRDYILALYLGRFAGLRIHECFRIDTATAEQVLRENAITIKGRGDKVRTVPIEDERITTHLKRQLEQTERGHKLLVPDGMPTDRAINQLQLFIYSNRGDFQEDANRPLTFHGLRHTYAAEKYTELIQNGTGALDAHFAVSRLLGHERADVTDIYLASLPKKGRHGKYGMNPQATGQTNLGGDHVINHTIFESSTCSPLLQQPQVMAEIPHPQGDASKTTPQCGGLGDHLDYQEITLGQVTYEISRVYTGERSAAELMSERLVKKLSENPSFDEQHTRGV